MEEQIAEAYSARVVRKITPSFGRPGEATLVVVTARNRRWLTAFRWGLIPRWAEDAEGVGQLHARAETLRDKVAWNGSLRFRRCILPLSEFCQRVTIPGLGAATLDRVARIRRPDRALMGVAAIWDEWRSPTRETVLRTCAVVTVAPNGDVAQIHHRMPAILSMEESDLWLNPDIHDARTLLSLLRSWPGRLEIVLPGRRPETQDKELTGDLFAEAGRE